MAQKLTKKAIEDFTYNGGWDIRWDTAISGFGVRIFPSGKKSYVLSYRHEGKKRLMKVDKCNKITLDEARKKTRRYLGQLAERIDPLQKKQKSSSKMSVENIFKDYLQKYAKQKNRSWKETERIFKADILPSIGKKQIHEVKKKDLIKIIDRISDRDAKTMANRTLAHIRKFFNWCHERDLIEVSPALNIPKPTQEITRDRVLANDEIKYLWQACDKEGFPFGDFVKIALLTAQRRNEIFYMRWQDLDINNAIWTIPKENTKSKRDHSVYLSPLAIQILKSTPHYSPNASGYIFSIDGEKPFNGVTKAKTRLENHIDQIRAEKNKEPMAHWRIHDLRRTAASGMASLQVSPHVIERILNHSSGIISGVAAVYNRYDYGEETKQALTEWSNHIIMLNQKENL